MAITSEMIMDIFNIPRDGSNIQDDEEENYGADSPDNVPFKQKAQDISDSLKRVPEVVVTQQVTAVKQEPVEQKKVEIKREESKVMANTKSNNSGMFGGLFDDDETPSVEAPKTEPKPEPAKGPEVAKVLEAAKPEPKLDPIPKVEPEKVGLPSKVEVKVDTDKGDDLVKAVVGAVDKAIKQQKATEPAPEKETSWDDVKEKPETEDEVVQEWSADDSWILSSAAPKYNKFYAEKKIALLGKKNILAGGQIDFGKYYEELANLNADIAVNTFDLEVIYQKMQTVQQMRERCKQIQLHISQQYYLWERYIDMFHGLLCRTEYERGKQDGIYHEHMRDMEHYWGSLRGIQKMADQVMRTLDGAFECLSRQVTIAMPMKDIERYGNGHQAAAVPRAMSPEQKKFDALPSKDTKASPPRSGWDAL